MSDRLELSMRAVGEPRLYPGIQQQQKNLKPLIEGEKIQRNLSPDERSNDMDGSCAFSSCVLGLQTSSWRTSMGLCSLHKEVGAERETEIERGNGCGYVPVLLCDGSSVCVCVTPCLQFPCGAELLQSKKKVFLQDWDWEREKLLVQMLSRVSSFLFLSL